MSTTDLLLGVTVSMLLAAVGTSLVRTVAMRFGIVAHVRPDRWHRQTTPLGGGVAIWFAVVAASIITSAHGGALLAAATLITATGLIDDIRPLRPRLKFALIVVAIAGPMFYHAMRAPGALSWDLALEFAWTLFCINALNLLDNVNGLAAGSALLSAIALIVTAGYLSSMPSLLFLAAALVAFLPFNFPTARVFMGDAGSMLLGYVLASESVFLARGYDPTAVISLRTMVFAGILLGLPVADTSFVCVTRLLRGQKISMGGRDHISHRLARMMDNDRSVVLWLWALQGTVSLAAIWFYQNTDAGFIAFVLATTAATVVALTIIYRRSREA